MTGRPIRRSRRSYRRFSVRGLIVLVLAIGGWLGWIVRSARVQREAVAAIQRAGGWVWYDWQYDHGRFIPAGKPWAPGWLVDRLGDDYFGHVVYAAVNEGGSDAVLSHIGHLSRLEDLELVMAPVTDDGLSRIRGLNNLRRLSINSAAVSDAGLAHLGGLKSLEHLILCETGVTGSGLAYLKGLPSLRILCIAGIHVTDVDLMHLRGLPGLQMLDLTGAGVPDAELEALRAALPEVPILASNPP